MSVSKQHGHDDDDDDGHDDDDDGDPVDECDDVLRRMERN